MKKALNIFRNHFVLFLLAGFFLLAVLILVFTEGAYDTGDGINHYLISAFAFKHPFLFLDHWGKPVFVLLSSPLAQLGFLGINLYNIICNIISAALCYGIVKKLGYSNAWLACVFVFFAPQLFVMMYSGLTEPTFAMVLSLSIFLIVTNNFIAAAIVVSFLPFVRTEGFFILPLFVAYFIVIRKFTPIFLLATGTLIYSILGYFVFHDLLWVIHKNPYGDPKNYYGTGSLFHFVIGFKYVIGLPLLLLFLMGVIKLFYDLIKRIEPQKKSIAFIPIFGSFALYFILHSVFWYSGHFSSLGLLRVIAAVLPMASIISLKGYNWMVSFNFIPLRIKTVLVVIFPIAVILKPFSQYDFPIQEDDNMYCLHKTADWLKEYNPNDKKIYAGYPLVKFYLETDVFDGKKNGALNDVTDSIKINKVPKGSIIVWDSHFGPESFCPLEVLEKSSLLQEIGSFDGNRNDESVVRSKDNFFVVVFEKVK